jgi:hypothetical protein
METTEFFLHPLVDGLVVGHGRFPAHTSEKSYRFHGYVLR